ncbi:hypothetical protein CNY89_28420, partial [Amaricoccus sp. HAR-UPW-R2A-40]
TYDWASSDFFREIDEEFLSERDNEVQTGLPHAPPIHISGRTAICWNRADHIFQFWVSAI